MHKYDVFISYRHGDPDRNDAIRLDLILQRFDIVVALDERDFSPQETFFDEMARCIQESRYTVALLSKRYLGSFNTWEESVMQKCLDNRERKRRLIPVYLEPCDPPLWLEPLVGIRLYEKDSKPSPIEKLIRIISETTKSNTGLNSRHIHDKIGQTWPKISNDLISGIGIGMTGYGILDHFFSKSEVDDSAAAISDLSKETLTNETSEALDEQAKDSNVDDIKDIFSTIKSFLSDIF